MASDIYKIARELSHDHARCNACEERDKQLADARALLEETLRKVDSPYEPIEDFPDRVQAWLDANKKGNGNE